MKRCLIVLLLAVSVVFALGAATAAADDPDPVASADPLDGGFAPDFQPPAANWLAPWCRYHNQAVFYSLSWGRLGQFLAADSGPCTDYYISIPPRDLDKTMPRAGEAAKIRALGLRFHALAEFNTKAWAGWIAAVPGRSWADAGREFRRRMAAAGFDVAAGDSWSLNELGPDVQVGSGSARTDMSDAINALAAGAPGMPYTAGTVFVISHDQRATDLAQYQSELKAWLADGDFWASLAQPVRFFAQETYADARSWGVAGSSRNDRARALNDYFEHLSLLAEAGGDNTTEAARFLRRTYLPLMNAAWRGNGAPDFGWTQVSPETMQAFVSEQVYANHQFAQSHPQLAPDGRLGFAYIQRKLPTETQTDFNNETATILQRLAAAITLSYAQGGGSPVGACEGGWCDGYPIDGAAFNDGWQTFTDWTN